MNVSPPQTEQELVDRAGQLAGLSLRELALSLGLPVPADLRRAKGFVGGMLERALGATAGSRALPDFPGLHIELKTLPVEIMLRGLPPHVAILATHPLFGPQSARGGIRGLKIAVCPVRCRRVARRSAPGDWHRPRG